MSFGHAKVSKSVSPPQNDIFDAEHPDKVLSAFLHTLLDSAEDAIITTNPQGKISSWNISAERLYGYESSQAIGEHISLIFPGEDREELEQLLSDLEQGYRKEPFIAARVRKNGTEIEVSVTVSPLFDRDGQYWGALFIQRDVTKRRQRDKERRRLASIVENADDAIIGKTLDGTITAWNHGAERMYGFTSEEAIGQPISIIIPDDRSHELENIMAKLRRGEHIETYETIRENKRGEKLHVSLRISPIRGSEGKITGASAVARDITARIQAEKERDRALQEERTTRSEAQKREEHLAFLVEASEVLASSLEYGTTLENVAKLAVKQFADWCTIDLLEEDEVRRVAVEHIKPEKKKLARELQRKYPPMRSNSSLFGQVVASGEPVLIQTISESVLQENVTNEEYLEILRELGLESAMVVPLSVRGSVIGVISLISENPGSRFSKQDLSLAQELARHAALAVQEARHVNRLKALNQQLEVRVQERTEALEKANRELESFSYSVSHDLRAPLRAIKGFGRILLEEYHHTLPEDGQRYLNLIDQNISEMGHLIDDLLTYSRISRRPTDKRLINMQELVSTVLDSLSNQWDLDRYQIDLRSLPEARGDYKMLTHIWQNLLSNAVKYSKKEEQPVVQISGSIAKDGIRYSVSDNGVGFNMKYGEKMFEVFQRLHRPEDYEGTGVGLAIAKQIIESHGGTIWAEAKSHEGAIFSFELPREGQNDAE
ncbi:MAG: PAS domain S-box protein [Candidatus Marinimicrobia bacterium]|nr:PAS domain S-box protein [Candidatus Neomarinimicrobiota bacterium]MCF7829642.1 PAS domain S-box protein [Candidatus Neomarinimicrobiota bacterium]MCF7879802.1 PAS domain S-box protein [Candidatus Neomarinimicrobiota bacterium]